MSAAPESRFSDRVENYVRYRPHYPPQVLAFLVAETGVGAGANVVDVGSGTGISCAMLLPSGADVWGVEPNLEMRMAAEHLLAVEPHFHSVAGRAQATSLPNGMADLIVAAQAFHWFNNAETRQEFDRILKPARPGGPRRLALVWNERETTATPFLQAYEQLLLEFATDYTAVRHENMDHAALAGFFHGPFITREFANEQCFDLAGLSGRLLSSSYAPAPGHPRHAPMMQALRSLYEQYAEAGMVRFRYRTSVHLGQ